MTSFEIWVYEHDRPVGRHSTVPLRDAAVGLAAGKDPLGCAMQVAADDVRNGRFNIAASRAGA